MPVTAEQPHDAVVFVMHHAKKRLEVLADSGALFALKAPQLGWGRKLIDA